MTSLLRHGPAVLVLSAWLLCTVGLALGAGSDQMILDTPKAGSAMITGQAPAGTQSVVITRTRKDGSKDVQTATPDPNGNFSTSLSSSPVGNGDKVMASAVAQTLPAVASIAPGPPLTITFQSALSQMPGPITIQIASNNQSSSWPTGFLGTHTGKVTDSKTIQLDGQVPAPSKDADLSQLTITTSPGAADSSTINASVLNFGRFEAYAYFGGAFSGDFSKKDPYLDFFTEGYYVKKRHTVAVTFFDTRLTQIPTTTTSSSSTATQNSGSSAQLREGALTAHDSTGSTGSQSTDSSSSSDQTASAFNTAAKSIDI